MDDERLALELLHELKSSCRRWFIAFIISIVMLFATNLTWLYAWNLPTESTSITQDSEDNGTNNIIGNDGYINGTTDCTDR